MVEYDRQYYKGNRMHCGSDICRKYDMHWWAYRYYAGLIKKYLKKGKVLELGCAHGYLLSFLNPSKYEKFGKDLSRYALDIAQKNNPSAKFSLGSVEDLREFESDSMDLVMAKYVLEHLNNPKEALKESCRVLKRGGFIIFAVPNTSSLLRKAKGKNWIGDRDITHKSVFEPEKWEELLKKTGFKTIKKFSDGFWDVPYVKYIPKTLQFPIFSLPTILQTFFIGERIPVRWGENFIVVARKI